MTEIRISSREAGQRIDKYLKKYFPLAPGSFIYKMLRKKNITLNGKKAAGSEIIENGDVIKLFLSDETISSFRRKGETIPDKESSAGAGSVSSGSGSIPYGVRSVPYATGSVPSGSGSMTVLYEDGDIALFVKPAGMLSQPGNGHELSAADLIPEILLSSGCLHEDDLRAFHPAPLNRLDRNTSGILLCGLSMKGAQTISRLIRSGEMKKEYLAIVQGNGLKDGTYSAYAVKDPKHNRMLLSSQPSKNAVDMVTGFHVLGTSDHFSLVKATLITGRTHQIRAQLSWLGFPVAGDRKYGTGSAGSESFPKPGRQMLHAFRVTFPENTDPCPEISGKIFTAEVPDDFRKMAAALNLKEALGRALTS
jgi:23S rRNA pseudouridine955/2504/2580 synthase